MNPIQKAYDSYDKNMKLLKLTNSFYHYRNLELIRTRKSPFGSPRKYPHKRRDLEPYQDYYVKGENHKFGVILEEIKGRKVKPKMNLGFMERGKKMRNFRNQHKLLFDNDLKRKNEEFAKRIMSQGPFFNSREMDREYNKSHPKILIKLKKIGNESIVLPKINSRQNPMLSETSKYYMTSCNQSKEDCGYNSGYNSGYGNEGNDRSDGNCDQRDKENVQDSQQKQPNQFKNDNNQTTGQDDQADEVGYQDDEANDDEIKEDVY